MLLIDLLISDRFQVLFDAVVVGLAKQDAPCRSPSGKCMYYYDEKRCAVGLLIRDEHIDKFPPGPIGTSLHLYKVKASAPKLRFLQLIQTAHDDHGTREAIARRLEQLATRFHLSASKVQECMNLEWIERNGGTW